MSNKFNDDAKRIKKFKRASNVKQKSRIGLLLILVTICISAVAIPSIILSQKASTSDRNTNNESFEVQSSDKDTNMSVADANNDKNNNALKNDNIETNSDETYILSTKPNDSNPDNNVPIIENGVDENQYWVIFKEGFRDGRIELSTFNASSDFSVIWDKKLICNNQEGMCNQYYYDNGEWIHIGTYNLLTDYALDVIASNVDICDSSNNIIINKSIDSIIPTSFDNLNTSVKNQSANIINGGHGVYDNGVYYLSGGPLRRVDTNNKEFILLDKTVYYLNIFDEYLYFTDSDNDYIYRIKTDGTRLELLCNHPSHELTLYEESLYYCADMGDHYSICKMGLDGSNQVELLQHNEWYMNVTDDYVYFTDYDDGRKIKRMKIDGSNLVTLNESECYDLCIVNDTAYYCVDSNSRYLHKMSLKSYSDSTIRESYTRYTNFDEKYLYYVDEFGNLCRYDMDKKEDYIIYESSDVSYITVLPGKIFYCNNKNGYKLEEVK